MDHIETIFYTYTHTSGESGFVFLWEGTLGLPRDIEPLLHLALGTLLSLAENSIPEWPRVLACWSSMNIAGEVTLVGISQLLDGGAAHECICVLGPRLLLAKFLQHCSFRLAPRRDCLYLWCLVLYCSISVPAALGTEP